MHKEPLRHRLADWLLRAALSAEARRAKLAQGAVVLPFGRVAYLLRRPAGMPMSEAVVMLHGAASDKTAWLRFAGCLRVALPLVAPDLPGHGDSSFDDALRYDIGTQADRLRSFLKTLGIERAHLIANSMGGAIALRLAAEAPEQVASLMLIDAAGAESTPSWLRLHLARTGRNPMLEVATAADYRAMMAIGMAKPPVIPGFLLAALARAFVRRQPINARIARDIEDNLDQTALLPRIVAPALIVWGREDKVMHVDDASLLHRQLRDSQKIVLDGVGHVPMVEAPRQVAAACNAFLARLAGARE
ncbi:alpha/beta fold hydrolase [Duganella rhizosphaerae]|uniref:alpha/beta fold hydrolase n=1 Tax=Duganella rhizosphaerae TaxID=2885763 RepID=UPI00403F5A14